jgi:hypothetical protein
MEHEHTIEDDGLHLVINGHYPIGWDTLKTHEDIVKWVLHIAPKRWVTTKLIEHFIEAACAKNRLFSRR